MAASGLIVQKYGGTSVGTPERIKAVADRIAATRARGKSPVVVVSAMGDTTDDLIELAHKVSDHPTHREMDMLLTAGERISMALLSMALADRQVPALSFTGSQSGIITDQSHRRARIRRILGNRVRDAVRDGQVAIVAGFQGVSETKEITTLGRGGSDTTAVALAAALGAEMCEIYTDVDGVYSADPRIVPAARHFPRVSHDLMVELATRGAGVLHPRSVELAKQYGVPLCVKHSLKSDSESEGTTLIPSTPQAPGMEDFRVVGVTADRDRMLLTVDLTRATAIGAIWESAAQAHLSLVTPVFSGGRVQCFVNRDAEADWRRILERLAVDGFVRSYDLDTGLIPLSVVGDRFSQDGAALQKVIETLATEQISVTMGSASALAITVAIPRNYLEEGVRALHREFVEPLPKP